LHSGDHTNSTEDAKYMLELHEPQVYEIMWCS